MESKKDIGKAFREKLDLLHKQPGDAVWDSIKSDLNKSRRKAIPVWLRFWGITGVFVIMAIFTYPLWENKVPRIYIEMPAGDKEQVTGTNEISTETGIATADDKNTGYGESTYITNEGTHDSNPISVATSSSTAGVKVEKTSSAGDKNINSVNKNTGTSVASQKQNSLSQQTSHNSTSVNQRATVTTVRIQDNNKAPKNGRVTNKNYPRITKGVNDIAVNDKKDNAKRKSADDDIDEGFIVPMSAAYQNYRNNIARGIPVETTVKDSTDSADFAQVTDSLRKIQSTGVQQVLKVPETKIEKEAHKNFYVYAFSAPTKYTLSGNGEYIDTSLRDKNTSAESSLAYGAYFGYNINSKISIRAGAIKSKVGLTTNSISISAPDFEGIEYNQEISNASIAGQMLQDPAETLSIRNNFEFIEVPVELTYNLYESKIGIGVLGGFITRFTTDNTVFAENQTGSMQIGKIKSLKEVNNGVSLGGNFHYNILPSLQLNAEPVYKYFFNKGQFIEQHTFSIQAGLQFNF